MSELDKAIKNIEEAYDLLDTATFKLNVIAEDEYEMQDVVNEQYATIDLNGWDEGIKEVVERFISAYDNFFYKFDKARGVDEWD